MGLETIKFETKDYVLLSVTVLGFIILYYMLNNKSNSFNNQLDQLSKNVNRIDADQKPTKNSLTTLKDKMDTLNKYINVSGNELRVTKDISIGRHIIMKPANTVSGDDWKIGFRDQYGGHLAINRVDRTGNITQSSGLLIRQDGHIWTGGGPYELGSYNPTWHNMWFHNKNDAL
jgi:hypothetical protein